MSVTINGTSGITTPDITSSGSLNISASAPDNSLVVNSSGNVGIGTSSAGAKLQVETNASGGDLAVIAASKTGLGYAVSLGYYASAGTATAGIVRAGNGLPLAFDTNGSERMRIDSSGNLLVGTTATFMGDQNTANGTAINPQGRISVAIDGANYGSLGYFNRRGSTDGSLFIFQRSGSSVGSISVTTSATTYATSSDYRLKENIQPMQNALGVVAQLNPVTYTWKADGSDGQGFIAHELQAVVPDCVTGEKDAVQTVDVLDDEGKVIGTKEEPVYQGIDTSFLVATLTKAIQEQQAQIETLTAKVAALEAK